LSEKQETQKDQEQVKDLKSTNVPESKINDPQPEEADLEHMKLTKSVEYEGVVYDQLVLNFDRLTGAAVTKAERLFRLKVPDHNNVQNAILSVTYWQILGSIAAGIPYEVVENMSMKDSIELVGRLKLFFEE
jgi:hypothetical protein